jgi:geranylgeranyl diphosphate synthase, type II
MHKYVFMAMTFPALSTVSPNATRIEETLEAVVARATGAGCPPRLAEALRYAVFPGGARLRPRLTLIAAAACGGADHDSICAVAAAIELIHCASLVHDDLPTFDNADTRRGRPCVHRVFGEAIALLVGDGLIVAAFDTLARGAPSKKVAPLVAELASGAGTVRGIVAGQAWESEPVVLLDQYHRAKTASLFASAGAMGAIVAGGAELPWRRFGEAIGRAYQVVDDLNDVIGSASSGKTSGRDASLSRPSIVRTEGVEGARARAKTLIDEAMKAAPLCDYQAELRAWVEQLATRALKV